MKDKKYIATRKALCVLVLTVGLLSWYIGEWIFPIMATGLVYVMVTDWKRVYRKLTLLTGGKDD